MTAWACEEGSAFGTPPCVTKHPGRKYKVPITIRIYGASEPDGAPYAEKTKTFGFTYRPSEDANKTQCPEPGTWYDASDTEYPCLHGLAEPVSIKLGKLKRMPTNAIITVSYPTETTQEQSLNVSVAEPTEPGFVPSVGSYIVEEWVVNSTYAAMYCPGAHDVGKLGYEEGTGCQGYGPTEPVNFQPVFAVSAE